MAGLRDQLLKSGLVNEKQVKKAQREKHKEQRAPHGKPVASEQQQSLQQRQAEKQERDRQLNQQRREESERRALAAQARQLIEAHRLARIEGELGITALLTQLEDLEPETLEPVWKRNVFVRGPEALRVTCRQGFSEGS